MDISTWLTVKRDDNEIVGYLEPLDAAYDKVRPRSVLGHPVVDACDYMDGEELLLERGIGELADHWTLHAEDHRGQVPLAILEVSANGIVVADALLTKALAPTERIIVPWPDVESRLIPCRGA
ncbi:hypothetical protein [Glutamicibacter sp.]|jgi:hypothetical protein|uniref:hypothetical protein n=1 Tax=Glutamicibacter sp. TaxID=1931995 RepID=UPI002B48D58D|nr:hypothetical protein [Glutamicibacter sp.]HJX78196.1 hypothetical protein [Glutamicibacter sp.]